MGALTRRVLLGSVAAAALGGAGYGASRLACRWVPRNHPDFFSLIDLVPDAPATRRVGELALASLDGRPGAWALRGALEARPQLRAALAEECPTARLRLVQDQCALDFAEGRIVSLDGWLLSETEAGLCAARTLRREA